ncbi:flavin reductase family protein, partial [Streptomyces tendae]
MAAMDVFLDRLDPDMCVVTAAAHGERAGCLVGFSSQCSIRPVRYVVWISDVNRTFRVARSADVLAVHLLARDQRGTAELFGGLTGDDVDKFRRVRWREASWAPSRCTCCSCALRRPHWEWHAGSSPPSWF